MTASKVGSFKLYRRHRDAETQRQREFYFESFPSVPLCLCVDSKELRRILQSGGKGREGGLKKFITIYFFTLYILSDKMKSFWTEVLRTSLINNRLV